MPIRKKGEEHWTQASGCGSLKADMTDWTLYIIRCADNTLYTGITTDVDRRFQEHQAGGQKAAKYLRGRGPLALIYRRRIGARSLASRVEHRIKRMSRAGKEALISDRSIMLSILNQLRAEARR